MKTYKVFLICALFGLAILALCGYEIDHSAKSNGLYILTGLDTCFIFLSAIGFAMTAPIKNSSK